LGQKTGLQLQRAAVAYLVVEQRMRQQRTHALLVHLEEPLPSRRAEVDRLASADEIPVRDHAVVDAAQDGGFSDQRPELLDQIQRQGGPAKARLMVKGHVRIATEPQR